MPSFYAWIGILAGAFEHISDWEDRDDSEIAHAIRPIERRIQLVRLVSDGVEFLTRTNRWVDVVRTPNGWRVRVYYRGRYIERVAASAVDAINEARDLARRSVQ